MNMNRYHQFLNELEIKHFSVDELVEECQKRDQKLQKKRIFYSAVCLIFIGVFAVNLIRIEAPVTITVYAAEGNHIDLSDEVTSSYLAADVSYMVSSVEEDFETNINLSFYFDGKNIDVITLTCSDTEISRKNLKSQSAYFVENIPFDSNMYLQMMKEYESKENFLNIISSESFSVITMLIGNSYSILYNEQDAWQYGIVLHAYKTKNGTYAITETIINVDILLENGKTVQRRIKIDACDDILTQGIEISLIK
ncbi:MAG: hypothetical protein HDR24_05875 [Lachnospiraceae bacterium]|nr:hypothetical protein [Lachnospiraceae bacterium]